MVSSYAMGLFFPWWTVAIAGLASGFFLDQKIFLSFLSAFIAVFLLWGIMSYVISVDNDHILASKISLMILKGKSPVVIILLGAFTGGIVSAFSAMTGSVLASVVRRV
jgi:hypothetical protein